jgi:NAD+ diphosphatase
MLMRSPYADMAPPDLGYAAGGLNRRTEWRVDADKLNAAAVAPAARWLMHCGDTLLIAVRDGTLDPLFDRASAAAVEAAAGVDHALETCFLGTHQDAPRFARLLDSASADTFRQDPAFKLIDLRSIAMQGLFPPPVLSEMATAKALFAWHARHRFCSNCGAPTTLSCAGWRRDCQACAGEHFPRTDPVVIMLATDGDRCLMGRQPRFLPNVYSCLAGFMEPGETLEDAGRRELHEEAGIATGAVSYVASQPWPFPSSLMIGCMADATSTDITIDRTELEDARWFTRDEVALILAARHPDGILAPAPMAIAHHLMRLFVQAKA